MCRNRNSECQIRTLTFKALLICILLALGACSRSRSENVKSSPPQATPAPQPQKQALPFIAVDLPHVTLMRLPNEPLTLLRADVDAKRTQLILEIQNVSDKTVRLATYQLGISPRCSEFMYAAILSPDISYGDRSVAGFKGNHQSDPPLEPQQKATIIVTRDQKLSQFLNAKTYRSCPEGHAKPELVLQNVYFDDGTEWRLPLDQH